MRLARDAANDAIHEATPGSASEGGDIAPHRRSTQDPGLHRCRQSCEREAFPLHQANWASTSNCQLEGEVEASGTGAEGDVVEGTISHIHAARTCVSIGVVSPCQDESGQLSATRGREALIEDTSAGL
jgi:hypothetical protein